MKNTDKLLKKIKNAFISACEKDDLSKMQELLPQLDIHSVQDSAVFYLCLYGKMPAIQYFMNYPGMENYQISQFDFFNLCMSNHYDAITYLSHQGFLDLPMYGQSGVEVALRHFCGDTVHHLLNVHHIDISVDQFSLVCRYGSLELLHYVIEEYHLPYTQDIKDYLTDDTNQTSHEVPMKSAAVKLFMKRELHHDLLQKEHQAKIKI